ncbi:P1 family peptidase [Nitratireductor basaltis]|uniref:Peptidase S58, DmpA n=1 Tax=Nitratireductor basaltis TaxID=472175 RepID=A0A084UBE5_9HYPH|nr:P1 family peptidase [Nitratireductor basaltis]KFB10281.1 Peptidase S58, DmpA [Nitratireductor basaltis]
MRAGRRNSITDIKGLTVGNAADDALKSGVTALICETPSVAAVQVLGGAPGTRETDLLEPHNLVEAVDGLVLSGGSAFGLDAASGVQAYLREQGRGFEVAGQRVPIVPGAILFDLANGGNKEWGRYAPYRELGFEAAGSASAEFAIGTAGAGKGATTAGLKGGLGTASTRLESGFTLGALVAVNALGSATIGSSRHFWAAPFELNEEFGGYGQPSPYPEDAQRPLTKFTMQGTAPEPGANTTIAVIATDAALTKAEAKRLAIAAHDGFARALWPAHTPLDGDLVFSLATGSATQKPDLAEVIELYAAAGATMTRAIARGVFEAQHEKGDIMPSWHQRHGA